MRIIKTENNDTFILEEINNYVENNDILSTRTRNLNKEENISNVKKNINIINASMNLNDIINYSKNFDSKTKINNFRNRILEIRNVNKDNALKNNSERNIADNTINIDHNYCSETKHCREFYICNINNECVHNDFFPLNFYEGLEILIMTIFSSIAISCGIGGGAIFSTLLLTFDNFDASMAFPIATFMVLFSTLSVYLLGAKMSINFPEHKFVNYDLVILACPMLLIGTKCGVFFNSYFPSILLILLLFGNIFKSTFNIYNNYCVIKLKEDLEAPKTTIDFKDLIEINKIVHSKLNKRRSMSSNSKKISGKEKNSDNSKKDSNSCSNNNDKKELVISSANNDENTSYVGYNSLLNKQENTSFNSFSYIKSDKKKNNKLYERLINNVDNRNDINYIENNNYYQNDKNDNMIYNGKINNEIANCNKNKKLLDVKNSFNNMNYISPNKYISHEIVIEENEDDLSQNLSCKSYSQRRKFSFHKNINDIGKIKSKESKESILIDLDKKTINNNNINYKEMSFRSSDQSSHKNDIKINLITKKESKNTNKEENKNEEISNFTNKEDNYNKNNTVRFSDNTITSPKKETSIIKSNTNSNSKEKESIIFYINKNPDINKFSNKQDPSQKNDNELEVILSNVYDYQLSRTSIIYKYNSPLAKLLIKKLKKLDLLKISFFEENQPFKWAKIRIIFELNCILFFILLMEGTKRIPSVINLSSCGIFFWLLFFSYIYFSYYITFRIFFTIKSEAKLSDLFTKTLVKEILFPNTLKINEFDDTKIHKLMISSFVSGLLSGMLGVGGGMVLTKTLLHLEVNPRTTTSTSNFLILISSCAVTLQFFLNKQLVLDYGFLLGMIIMLSSLFGFKIINERIISSGRRSELLFLLFLIMVFCCILLPIALFKKIFYDMSVENDVFYFREICVNN